ncbi:CRTAC1 family protein [Paludisphaera mucosa]|uniref:CRTAC1 family protein n=1 Tax=Paludisphaera mucosa TaxID=3030827 RepID=A0ABT6FGH3_9BACT|nr:CRTAC1 family protein [Paludisphaera mucosa]MDG3006681.1 CRTAC1 family protein [Paludisphaera mucosa]
MRRGFAAILLATAVAAAHAQALRFEDVAAEAGIAFRFDSGSRGRHDLPEIMGGGLALFDADGDGLLDVYLCNGGPVAAGAGGDDPPCRLYRNLGGLRFEDRTATAAAPGPGYAMGAAAGDFDGDGRVDLFVSGWRGQRLYRNLGGCRFADVTDAAGLGSKGWTTGAAWADLDGDGDLDLYVAAYVDYDADSAPYCAAPDGRRDFCAPEDFEAQPHRLYRNDGGVFTDVAGEAGLPRRRERGLGVLIADFDGDRRPDVYVANDGGRCWLLANRGGMRFEDVAEEAGAARDGRGRALAGMGVAFADLDGDGLPDLAVTNFHRRSTVAFRAVDGLGGFQDDSERLGLAGATREVLGFGIVAADFDADGRVDLLQADGHVLDRARLGVPFAMPPILLRGRDGGFDDASRGAGPWFARPALGRGLAVGDVDDDGRLDVAAAALDAPFALLHNRTDAGPAIRVDLVDRRGLPAIGARVRARIGGRTIAQDLIGGGSYLSSSPPRLIFGLGAATAIDVLEVSWPWGALETWRDLRPGEPALVVEGSAPPRPPDEPAAAGARPGPEAARISARRP